MNIGELAKTNNVTADTVRYYEKQGLLSAPSRQDNGYRSYTQAHVETLRFVRGAQALGFSLAEIRAILPRLTQGKLECGVVELQLQAKMQQIDAHILQLQTLKKELETVFESLTCARNVPVSVLSGAAVDAGSGAGVALVHKAFAKPAAKTRSRA